MAAWQDAREWPPAGVPWIGGLAEVAERYDAFLVDLWGVIHNGSVAFPWAVRTLEELKKRGKKVLFLSNSSRRRETNARALERLGVAPELYVDLITSGDETFKLLGGQGGACAVGVPDAILKAEKLLTLGNAADDVKYLDALLPTRKSAPVEEAELILARGCSTICDAPGEARKASWQELEEVLQAAAHRGVPMLVANPDSVRPDGDDSPMPGRLAARYAQLGGPPAHFIGKPYRAVYDAAMARLRDAGLPEDASVCMVGDSAWHDVRGACAAGLDVVLLCSGVHYTALGVPQAPQPVERPAPDRLQAFLGALAPEEQPTHVAAAFSWDDPCAPQSSKASQGVPRVLVCGLACLDHLQVLESFPAPDAKVASKENCFLGGGNAANTACALSRLGAPSALVSQVGGDAFGEAVLEGLRGDGVDTRFVLRQASSNSALSTVLVDGKEKTRTSIHSPMTTQLGAAEARGFLEGKLIPGVERPLLAPGVEHFHMDGRNPEAAADLAEAARAKGITVTLDAERLRPGLDRMMEQCDGIFCNATFPQVYTGEGGLPRALAAILDKFPRARFVLATRGERGSLLLARHDAGLDLGASMQWPAEVPLTCCHGGFGDYRTIACDAWPLPDEASIVDSTGAGDNFIGGFLHAWLAGRPLSAAMATGSFVATRKLQQLGARLGPDFDAASLPFGLGS